MADHGLKVEGQELHHTFGTWLQGYDWGWWGTAEFDPKKPLKDAMRAKGYFKRYVEKELDRPGIPLSYFLAVERFQSSYDTHIHFLLAGICEGQSKTDAGKIIGAPWWKKYHGYFWLEPYDPQKGAGFYLMKYVSKGICDWDFRLKHEHQKEYSLFNGLEVVNTKFMKK